MERSADWMDQARGDLQHARSDVEGAFYDWACFSAQQAAEKAVKGFLALHDHRPERSHDVERLVELAQAYEARFADWEEAAITLTPYATAYRYPGESATLEPSRAEFDEALELAAELLNFVLSLLPNEVRPNG